MDVNEVWIGYVEVRQLPGVDHQIALSGRGAYVWVACWANDEESYRARVEEVGSEYGLFVVEVEEAIPLSKAEDEGIPNEEIANLCEQASKNGNYCIFGTFHSYPNDN
jgi:hypothetical protein